LFTTCQVRYYEHMFVNKSGFRDDRRWFTRICTTELTGSLPRGVLGCDDRNTSPPEFTLMTQSHRSFAVARVGCRGHHLAAGSVGLHCRNGGGGQVCDATDCARLTSPVAERRCPSAASVSAAAGVRIGAA